jgi:hypothetical protein
MAHQRTKDCRLVGPGWNEFEMFSAEEPVMHGMRTRSLFAGRSNVNNWNHYVWIARNIPLW